MSVLHISFAANQQVTTIETIAHTALFAGKLWCQAITCIQPAKLQNLERSLASIAIFSPLLGRETSTSCMRYSVVFTTRPMNTASLVPQRPCLSDFQLVDHRHS